jgi:hypothetical protein
MRVLGGREKKYSRYTSVFYALLVAFFSESLLGPLNLSFERARALQYLTPDTFYLNSLGRFLTLFITLYIIALIPNAFRIDHAAQSLKDILWLSIIAVTNVVIIAIFSIIGASLSQYAENSKLISELGYRAFFYAIPFATGCIVIQSILSFASSLCLAVSLFVIVTLYFTGDPILSAHALVTSLVACISVRRVRNRLLFFRIGLNISLFAISFALISILVNGEASLDEILLQVAAAAISGVLCAIISAAVLTVVEYLGGYVTDIRLIEMATLDHPLLKELSIQAPGTWNHSMVMGMMAETAADAVGANSVLAKVGAYFHDVGKTKKPLYFVENQAPGDNRHDKLSPSMSALIIRSHVKDGIELARKFGLPKPLQDMIEQHHGTSQIEFFYDKALKEAENKVDGKEVDRSIYCYPGPRPQTREAGILMLADGIEAASRTMQEPTSDRIQGMVQKMINKVFASGQLNECPLTLSDLNRIARSFTGVLASIHHQRIAYAVPVEKGVPGSSSSSEEVDGSTGVNKNFPKKEEDLKRLGIDS